MAQYVELRSLGNKLVYVKCSTIEAIQGPDGLLPDALASPTNQIQIHCRGGVVHQTYGVSLMELLHAINRDDVFLDSREDR